MNETALASYLAVCPQEFRQNVSEELLDLGAVNIVEGYKAVYFQCDDETAYRIHLQLSTASKILLVLREGFAKDPSAIFFQATKIHWQDYMDSNYTFMVEGVAGDRLPESPKSNDISKAIREAIQKQFKIKGLKPPVVDLQEPRVKIVGFYYQKKICISIDTSGKSLHKRGYKLDTHPAPLKEHVAANILRSIGYDGHQTIWDPMCGSGTIAIEACYKSMGKGALIHRRKGEFGIEQLKIFKPELWRSVQNETRLKMKAEPSAKIFASDVNHKYVGMTSSNALRARVEKHINIKKCDFFEADPGEEEGILVFNMPYGERLNQNASELENFYENVGAKLKKSFSGWTAALVVSEDSPWQKIGLHPKRRIKMENGGLPCRLLVFELYKGSRRGVQE